MLFLVLFLKKIKKCYSTLWYLCVAGVKIWRVLENVKNFAVDHKISSMFLLYLNDLKKILHFAVYSDILTVLQNVKNFGVDHDILWLFQHLKW